MKMLTAAAASVTARKINKNRFFAARA